MPHVHHMIDEDDDLIVSTKFGMTRFKSRKKNEQDDVRRDRKKRSKARGQRIRADRARKFSRGSVVRGAGV